MFLATGVERVAAPDPGAGEAIAVRLRTPDEVREAVAEGTCAMCWHCPR